MNAKKSLAVCLLLGLGLAARGQAQTFTLQSVADTSLREGAANQSRGGEPVLDLAANQRALVRFDTAGMATAVGSGRLVSASLELYVRSATGNWGAEGRPVEARRLTAAWTEAGATWNCAADSQPGNNRPDCATQWNGGTFEEDSTDAYLQTRDDRRWVQLDVTADVAAFLAGTPNQGWLLLKTEDAGAGRLEYASREGAAAERPRLVLLVESAANDQVPPSLAITSPVRPVLVNEPTPTVTLAYADGGSGVDLAALQLLVDGQDRTASCTAGAQSASCPLPALAAGDHTVQARLRDRAGNAAQASFAFRLLLGTGPHLVTFQTLGDTHLRKSQANSPQGADPALSLREGGRSRTLVQFDAQSLASALAGGTLVSAFLELHIERNGGNWGKQGRTVDAHRATAAWTEAAATWSCAVDTIPSNNRADCAAQWNGGSFAPAPTASVLHTRDLVGWVSFDVTADVAAFLAGTPHHGWLIKKTEEKKSGRVDYDARQGTAGEGPRLVVVFETAGGGGDTTAPEVVVLRPGASLAGNNASVPIIVSYDDAGSGVALNTLQVSVDGADVTASCEVRESSAACTSPPVASGAHTVTARIRDTAGNLGTGSQTFSFVLDQTPPTITASVAPPPNVAGWNNTPVTISYACADAGTGVLACPEPVVVETEGEAQRFPATVLDLAGNATTIEVTVSIDRTPPAVEIASPASGGTTNSASVDVSGSVSDRFGVASADLNGAPVSVAGEAFTATAPLGDGGNVLRVTARDRAGNAASASVQVIRFAIPEIAVTSPAAQTRTEASVITVEGTVSPGVTTVTINGTSAVVSGTTFSAADVPLLEGNNILAAVAVDGAGRMATAAVQVIRDPRPPRLVVHSPVDGAVVSAAAVTVQGMVNDLIIGSFDASEAEVRVNGVVAQVANRSFLAAGVPLSPGPNLLTVTATDLSGNSSTVRLTVTRQEAPAGRPRLRAVSGDLQSGPIGAALPDPLVVALTDAAGLPLGGQPVVFRVAEGDGSVSGGGPAARTLVLTSDAQGLAQVSWTLGTRSGAGKNRVEATTPGISGGAVFHATGDPSAPEQISQDAGTRQFGLVSQSLPHPFVAVVTDLGHNRMPGVPVTFRVARGDGSFAGEESITIETDAYGRASTVLTLGPGEGVENNVVEADFPGNAGLPAVFRATGQVAGDAAATRIRGVVLDNSNLPIAGVTVSVIESGQTTQTDAQGQFLLTGVPVGRLRLIVEGSTADRPGSWPSLDYEMVTLPGRENVIGMPVYLLPIDVARGILVDETRGGRLTLPELPGFSLEIAPGSATFPGGSRSGLVSVTLVHSDKVPMVPNFGQQPRFIVTIQPAGTRFDPPAALTLPNVDGLAPGQVTEMYSFDHDIGMFVSIGTASVSEDGSVLRSDPGVGVVEGGWHCGGNPSSSGGAENASVQITSQRPQKLQKDKTATVTATGSPAGGTYEWSTDRPDIVSFQGSTSGSSVVIKALRASKAKVKVRYTCPSGATAEDEIEVQSSTADVVVVAWVDGAAARAELNAAAPNASFLLKIDLNTPVICSALVLDWTIGLPTDLFGEGERIYANAFLLANSANNPPAGSIDPAAVLAGGDYRLFNRYQVMIEDVSGPLLTTLQSASRVGDTPNPCGLIPRSSGPEVHPNHGQAGLTPSRTGAFHLAEGRLGTLGQRVNQTINGRSTPWIFSVIRFDLQGSLSPNPIDRAIFPTYFVYENGALVGQFPQAPSESFIALDGNYQRLPSQVP